MLSLCFVLLVGHAAGHGGFEEGHPWHHHGHDHQHGHDHHGGHHGGFMKKMFREAHACHERCGEDRSCHEKCPKPWEPLVKSCEEFPAVKKCYDACKTSQDKGCLKSCPHFSVDWIQAKFDQNPDHAMMKGEQKCPEVKKMHTCHEKCQPGDHECHHKCGRIFGHHGFGHHGFDHHEARACREKCGDDRGCHDKCPKPWEPIVKSCEEFPAIKKCYDACKRTDQPDCLKSCPSFSVDWIKARSEHNPERAMKMGEWKCPKVQKIHKCHQACKPGDHECHHNCGSVFRVFEHSGQKFGGDWEKHHGFEHGDHHFGGWENHRGQRDSEEFVKAETVVMVAKEEPTISSKAYKILERAERLAEKLFIVLYDTVMPMASDFNSYMSYKQEVIHV